MQRLSSRPSGYTLIEVLLVLAMSTTVLGLALPAWSGVLDHLRAASGARYIATRVAMARLEAVRRSSVVALRFEVDGDDYVLRPFLDGNGNGLRALDVRRGIDTPLAAEERLRDQFSGVRFGLAPGIPDLDGATGNADGVRIGSSAFLSLSPAGGATGGTLYIRGERAQYALRILGSTARARFFQYDAGARRWIAR